MQKEKPHNVSRIFNVDGTLNPQAYADGAGHFVSQGEHYHVENGVAHQHQVAPGRVRIVASFDQVENDPAVKAADHPAAQPAA